MCKLLLDWVCILILSYNKSGFLWVNLCLLVVNLTCSVGYCIGGVNVDWELYSFESLKTITHSLDPKTLN
jgi:hypothetical protein